MAEPGKRFENNVKISLPGIIRLYDTTNGYAGVKNPSDFVYYVYPYEYLIECKSVKGDRFDFSLLTDNQCEQLDYHDTIYGKTSIVLVEFRGPNEIYAIPYKLIKQLNKQGKKSIHYMKDNSTIEKFKVVAKYARVNCVIDEAEFKQLIHSISGMRCKY